MIKRMVATLALAMLMMGNAYAGSGLLFKVLATGEPGNVSITLCLNGKGPLSCQNYTISALNLTISTTIPNHFYPAVGIKINTPGYTIGNLGLNCTLADNGYCLFSVSNQQAATIFINQSSGYSISGTISNLATSGLVLQNNNVDNLTVSTGATSFQFATPVAFGGSYNVTILQQPMGLSCTVSNGSGTNVIANVTNVAVSCLNIFAYVANKASTNGTYNVSVINTATNLLVDSIVNGTKLRV